MNKKTLTLHILTTAILACVIFAAKTATAAPGWRYKASHGMKSCEFAAPSTPTDTVNGGVISSGNGAVTIAGQIGSSITLRLICSREQKYNAQTGDLESIGPEVSYSGPGSASVIGVEKPGDSSSGYELPKGREWVVAVAASPATYTLKGGGDSIAVTIQPIVAPVSQEQLAPVAKDAADAKDSASKASRTWENRIFQITGNYTLKLNSFGEHSAASNAPEDLTADATQGWGLDANVLLGSGPTWRFLTGLHYNHLVRQKPVLYAPNMPSNGFNSFVDWQTHFIAAKVGVEVMPASWAQLMLWGALGPMISVDGTIPVSQLPDRTLYSGESDTVVAIAGKLGFGFNFVIMDHLVIGPSIAAGTNFSKLPMARGPERVCNSTDGSCLVRRDGHVADILFQPINIGGQW
jgi:hypothetical protein